MSCGIGCRRSWDPALLWLWRRPVFTALIKPLAWEPPYAAGAALEKEKRQNKTKQNKKTNLEFQAKSTHSCPPSGKRSRRKNVQILTHTEKHAFALYPVAGVEEQGHIWTLIFTPKQ